jgi:hypothetical protein
LRASDSDICAVALALLNSAKRRIDSRKRVQIWDDADINYISESNRLFNSRVDKHLGKYTAGIKAAIERGTAL